MNKPLVIAAGGAAVILLASPWLVGALAEQRVNAGIERLDAENNVEASVVDYARGWSTSTATIAITNPRAALAGGGMPSQLAPLAADLSQPIRLIVTLQHGPLLIGTASPFGLASSTIRLDPEIPGYREFLEETGIDYLFEIRTATSFGGESQFVAEMPAFSLERDEYMIAFDGADSSGSYDAITRRFVAQGSLPQLNVEATGSLFAIEGLSFDSDSVWRNELLRIGYAAADVARIEVNAPLDSFSLDDIAVRFDVALEDGGETAKMTSDYRLGHFSDVADAAIDDLNVTATARRIDVDALTAYYDASQSSIMQNSTAAPLALTAEDALYDLLNASPELEISPLQLRWGDEPFDATLRISVDGENLPPRSSFTLLALAFQGVLRLDATLALSEPLAMTLTARGMAFQIRRAAAADNRPMNDAQLDTLANAQAAIALAALVAQGMVTSVDGGYETNAQFANGQLTVNGNLVPLGIP